jgi:hypothetical protein
MANCGGVNGGTAANDGGKATTANQKRNDTGNTGNGIVRVCWGSDKGCDKT